MANQEVLIRFLGDPAQLKAALKEIAAAHNVAMKELTKQAAVQGREEARAEQARARSSEQLQRQRSRAIIQIWNAEAREKEQIARRVQRNIDQIAASGRRTAGSGLSGIGTQVGAALFGGLAVASIVSTLRDGARELVSFSGRLEQARIGFTTLTGSSDNALKHLKELQAFANTSPFQFEELINSSRRLQALGFTADEVIPILRDVGNAVSAVGGTSETLDRVTLALAQMQSKGKVATQELNQLAEAHIPAWKILEDAFGKSRAELVKLVEDGRIASKVYIDAFREFSRNNYGDAMEKQSHTFLGAWSTIKDAVLLAASEAFGPTFKQLSKDFDALGTDIQNNGAEWQKWRQIINLAVDGLDFTVGNVLRGIKAVMLDVAYAQQQLNEAVETFRSFEAGRLAEQRSNALDLGVRAIIAAAQSSGVATVEPEGEFAIAQGRPNLGPIVRKPPELMGGKEKKPKKAGKTDAQRELERQLAFFKEITAEASELTDALEFLMGTVGSLDTKTREYAVSQAIANGALEKAAPGLREMAMNAAKISDAKTKEIRLLRELTEFQEAQNAAIKIAIEGEATFMEQANALIVSLEKQGKQLSVNEVFWLRFNASILTAVGAIEKAIDAEQRLRDVSTLPGVGGVEGDGKVKPGFPGDAAGPDIAAAVDPDISAIETLGQAIRDNLIGDTMTAATAGLGVMVGVFQELGQAVGQVIHSFVLYGSAGTSVRKVTAQILASVAQQAAIKAIFELAEGFAALALAFFGIPNAGPSAQAHFTAAAIYGGIAGVAVVSGRVISGQAFAESTGGKAGGSSGGSRGSGPSTPKTIEADRRGGSGGSSAPAVNIYLSGEATEAFNFKVVKAVIEDHRLNGPIRVLTERGES